MTQLTPIASALTFVPRWYQEECVQAIFNYFAAGNTGNPICALPTGSGKSLVIAMFLERIFRFWPNQRILMLTHSKELIEQNAQTLLEFWPAAPVGINSASLNKRDIHKRIVYGGIGSVANHAEKFGHVDLIVIDEADLVSHRAETQYRKFINQLLAINPHLKVVGLTATPWRQGYGHIASDDERGIFTDVCYNLIKPESFLRLISEGYLSMLIAKDTATKYDLSGIKVLGGDFKQDELEAVMDREEITYEALRETATKGAERKHWLIFATGVEHAKHIQAILNEMGYPCGCVYSGMPKKERESELAKFKSGEYRAMSNANILTVGYDFKELDLIVVLRPTHSVRLHCQMLGRGLRVAFGKQNCLVLDFAGNTLRLGAINDPVIPTKKKKVGGGEAPCKVCPHCDTILFASARTCFECGHEFPVAVALDCIASDAAPIKIGVEPIIEILPVELIIYALHQKAGAPPSLQVSYSCGLKIYREWVCPEHVGFPSVKAKQWWKRRSDLDMPLTAEEMLTYVDSLPTPRHIRVWVNAKFPEIKDVSFDGRGFGTIIDPETDFEIPVEINKPAPIVAPTAQSAANLKSFAEYDDDIPF